VAITRDTQGYRLTVDETTVDLHRFRALIRQASASTDDQTALTLLEQALTLWHGDPFAGLDTAWLANLRTALVAERYAAELDRTDRALRCGRAAELVAELSVRVAEHPLDERLAGQFLLALCRTGRPADALTHYQQMRTALAEELGCDPSPALQAIYHQILTGEDHTDQPANPTPSRPTPVPRQLPAAPVWFTGREPELAELSKVMDAMTEVGRTVVISAIGGAGGIGKTWLAVHWAYQHLDRFPDGQLFVDLQGFAPAGEPVSAENAVRGFLAGLGVNPARIPVELDAQITLYRSMIADRRMLIVLDNAADAAQVVPLLPGSPTCTVLITSRRYLPSLVSHHNAQPFPLDVLTHDEARDLLYGRLGAERMAAEAEAVATLVAWCGGFPLALGIVVGRALAHPDFPLSVLAAEISDDTTTLGALDDADAAASLPAVLSWSVRALTTEQARLFGLVGIAPGPDISVPAAASLAALPERQVRAVLRELEHASLVQQHVPGRYRMHDLIRLYATTTAHRDIAGDARDAALRRVVDFYTHTAHTAFRLLHPHRSTIPLDPPAPGVRHQHLPDVPTAQAWLDSEHPVLLAAQHTAASHAWYSTVWQLASTLDTFHIWRGHHDDRFAMWRLAVDAIAHLPDPTPRIIAHRALGDAYVLLNHHEEGIGHLHQALALAEEHHDVHQQARTHQVIAGAWEHRGDNRQALQHATRSLDLYRTLDQPMGQAEALNAVGWFAARCGEYDTAHAHCQAALTLNRHHHNPYGEAETLDSLGYIAHHTGHHQPAIDYYQQALAVRRALGATSEVAETLDALGHPHVALGEHEQARAVWREAQRLYQEQGRDTDAEHLQQRLDTLGQ
jgi:tetratricopeptide (TPR) repeat protein